MGGAAKPRIGFIGIGKMGWPMAKRLAGAGFDLTIADLDSGRVEGFRAEAQARPAASLEALGLESDLVITMLPDGHAVRAVLCGRQGSSAGDRVTAGLRAGALVMDMSSSSPVGTRELGAQLAQGGLGLLDAPVSGGVKRAIDGTLAIMVGGEAQLLERARPALAVLGRDIFHTGPLGSGHAMKALNNYVSAAGLVAAAEALRMGARFGLEPATMVDILNASTGRNNSTENKLKQFILSRSFASGFSLGLMAKDLRTVGELARAIGMAAPLEERCEALWREAEERLGGAADHTEIARYLEMLGAAGERG